MPWLRPEAKSEKVADELGYAFVAGYFKIHYERIEQKHCGIKVGRGHSVDCLIFLQIHGTEPTVGLLGRNKRFDVFMGNFKQLFVARQNGQRIEAPKPIRNFLPARIRLGI